MRSALMANVLLAILMVFGSAASPASTLAQSSEEAGRAISTVMNYRRSWMDDPAQFDACSVRRAIHDADDFASYILEPVRGLLDDTACPRAPRDPRDYSAVVLLDSLRFADATAHVYVTVLRGELQHREIFTLDPHRPTMAYMPVREVRLWGHGRSYGGWAPPPAP